MSIHVPLMSLGPKSCLKFAKNSHLLNDKKIQFYKSKSLFKKGSNSISLGNHISQKNNK